MRTLKVLVRKTQKSRILLPASVKEVINIKFSEKLLIALLVILVVLNLMNMWYLANPVHFLESINRACECLMLPFRFE